MKKTKKAVATFAVKAADLAERTFEGLASTWEIDAGGDIVHRGAYARTLDHWRGSAGKRVIPLIDQHNYGSIRRVVGKLIEAEETDEGLRTKWQVVEGEDGDAVLARVKDGYVNGLSIGYETVKGDTEQITVDGETTYIRHLRELKLYEVSLVIWGMNEGALIDTSSVKALLEARRAGDVELTPEQEAQIVAEVKSAREDLDALLVGKESEKKDDTPPALAPEQVAALRQRLLSLKLRRLGTRSLDARPATLGENPTRSNSGGGIAA
jgi:HK97 family phage prohead protease